MTLDPDFCAEARAYLEGKGDTESVCHLASRARELYEDTNCASCPFEGRLTFATLAAFASVLVFEHGEGRGRIRTESLTRVVAFAGHALHEIARLEEANRQLRERLEDVCGREKP